MQLSCALTEESFASYSLREFRSSHSVAETYCIQVCCTALPPSSRTDLTTLTSRSPANSQRRGLRIWRALWRVPSDTVQRLATVRRFCDR